MVWRSPALSRAVPSRSLRARAGGWTSVAVVLAALAGWMPTASAGAQLLRGTLAMHRCGSAGAFCGQFERPLDPLGLVSGTLSIGFEFYPHRSATRAARDVLVATEGGPGFPARESRADYLSLFRPLMGDHDVLIMDNRGTGTSQAIDCPSLQRPDATFTVEAVGECGTLLAERAWLYSTAYVADDLDALLDALGITSIDLYGDSYGTFTAQTFAVRHPKRLRSVVLDGAYPLRGPDAGWYPSYPDAMRAKFNASCERSPACSAQPGTSIEHIRPALALLRRAPHQVTSTDADGRTVTVRADAAALATAMFGGAPALATVRELDAAARAYADGDPVPLVRLLAEAHVNVDSRDATYDPRAFSSGAAAAVMCGDAPQIYDMTLSTSARREARDRAVAERAARDPDAYAPFDYDEYRSIPLDYGFIDECVLWPPVSQVRRAAIVTSVDAKYPDVPVLVLSGELDNMTTVADGADVARSFPKATQVVLRNSFHVNALPRARSPCGAALVRRFIRTGRVSDGCSSQIPPVRLVGRFATRVDQLEPATPLGASPGRHALQVTTAIVQTLGDVVVRANDNTSGHGRGLRGGDFQVTHSADVRRILLHEVRWTSDLPVDGEITVDRRTHQVMAHAVARDFATTVDVVWRDSDRDAQATVTGLTAQHRFSARTRAP